MPGGNAPTSSSGRCRTSRYAFDAPVLLGPAPCYGVNSAVRQDARGFADPLHRGLGHCPCPCPAVAKHVTHEARILLQFSIPRAGRGELLVDEFPKALLRMAVSVSAGSVLAGDVI